MPRKAGGEGSSSEMCFSFAERPAPPPARLGGMRLDQTPLQQFYEAVRGAGAAGVLNPELRRALAIDDKHGHRIKALLEQHGVAVRSELYGRTTAFRLVLLSAETSLTAAPAATAATSTPPPPPPPPLPPPWPPWAQWADARSYKGSGRRPRRREIGARS